MSFFQSLLASSANQMLSLVVGDSNANGFSDAITSTTSGSLFNFNDGTGVFDLITTESVSNGNPTKGSIWQKMADVIYADSGRATYLVNAALGGSDISPAGDLNDWSTTGLRYPAMQAKVTSAIAAIGGGYVGRIYVNVGVNDVRATTAIATITTHWNSLLDRLHADFPLAEILIINVGRIEATGANQLLVQIRDLIVETVWDRAYCHLINSGIFHLNIAGAYEADNLHYSQTTNNSIGESAAKWERYSTYSKWARSIIAAHFDDIDLTARNRIETFVTDLGADLQDLPLCTPLMSSDVRNYLIDFTFRSFNGAPSSGFVQAGNDWLDTNNSTANCFPVGYFNGWATAGGNSGTDFNFGVMCGAIRTPAGTAAAIFGTNGTTTRIQLGHGNLTSTVNYYANTSVVRNYADQDLVPDVFHSVGRSGGNEFYHKDATQVDIVAQAHTDDLTSAVYVGCLNSGGLIVPLDADLGFVVAFPSSVDRANLVSAMETYLGL